MKKLRNILNKIQTFKGIILKFKVKSHNLIQLNIFLFKKYNKTRKFWLKSAYLKILWYFVENDFRKLWKYAFNNPNENIIL